MLTSTEITVIATVLIILYLLLVVITRAGRKTTAIPANTILIDGSTVAHWGGEPSTSAVRDVAANLTEMGYLPVVFFDANIGYKLAGRHMSEAQLARQLRIGADQVVVVPSGSTADEHLLDHATDHDLQIVTNDRFRDWAGEFPAVQEHGFLLKGAWVAGEVSWRFPGDFRSVE